MITMKQGEKDFLKTQKIAIGQTKNLRIWLTDYERVAFEKSGLALRLWIKLTYQITLRVWLYWVIVNWEQQKANPKTPRLPTHKKCEEVPANIERKIELRLIKKYSRVISDNLIVMMKLSRGLMREELPAHRDATCSLLGNCANFARIKKFAFSCIACSQAKNLKT